MGFITISLERVIMETLKEVSEIQILIPSAHQIYYFDTHIVVSSVQFAKLVINKKKLHEYNYVIY